jgi:hypothetical protein
MPEGAENNATWCHGARLGATLSASLMNLPGTPPQRLRRHMLVTPKLSA